MNDQTRERWFQLCQLASVEQDPRKLLALVTEINCLLEAKETKLKGSRSGQSSAWNQLSESDKHQDKARQPYRSREHDSDSSANDPRLSVPTKPDSEESE